MRDAQMPAKWWSEERFVPAHAFPSTFSHTLAGTAVLPFHTMTPPGKGSVLTLRLGPCIISPHSTDLDFVDFAAATSHPCRGRAGVRM